MSDGGIPPSVREQALRDAAAGGEGTVVDVAVSPVDAPFGASDAGGGLSLLDPGSGPLGGFQLPDISGGLSGIGSSISGGLSDLGGSISSGLGNLGSSLGDLGGDLGEGLGIGLFKPPRKIGTVVPECVIDEAARDDLEITRHPIETGAAITDHAFKIPSEVVVRAGWSDSGSLPGYAKRAYDSLLKLQETRQPFTLMTGKKSYPNMLIASISQHTDARTEHALVATIVCRQIMIVTAATTTVGAPQNQAAPQSTAATQPSGDRQAQPAGTTAPAAPTSNQTTLGQLGSRLSGAVSSIKGALGF